VIQRQAFKPGAKVEGYTVLTELGRGAASVIYLVQDPKSKQIWALKHVVKDSPKDERFLEQTEREAEAAERLNHPAVRKVEKVLKVRKLLTVKEIFLVMEYVDGISVERKPPRTLVEALNIFKQTAQGLAHMHSRGWVHADMKPNNVVLQADGTIKIIDLGQSCASGTVKERIQGTPDYIAPEQVHRKPITPKTDIYNLGATMYWCLTGKHIPTALPKGESLVSSLDPEFIEKPKPVIELNPKVPQRLSDLIMECVEVDPDRRPDTMAKVADRLDLMHAQLLAEDRLKGAAANSASGIRPAIAD